MSDITANIDDYGEPGHVCPVEGRPNTFIVSTAHLTSDQHRTFFLKVTRAFRAHCPEAKVIGAGCDRFHIESPCEVDWNGLTPVLSDLYASLTGVRVDFVVETTSVPNTWHYTNSPRDREILDMLANHHELIAERHRDLRRLMPAQLNVA